jgi:phage gpG-like protein
MPLKVEIQGLARMGGAGAEISAARTRVKEMLTRATNNFANDAVARIKRDYLTGPRPAKLGVVTGRLRSSIRFAIGEEGDLLVIRFGTDVPYARVHELGERPFSFTTERGKKRTHPGFRPRPFLKPGTEDAVPGYISAIHRGLEEIGDFTDGK